MLDWKKIHPEFTPELKREWENEGFDYKQCKEWVNIGLEFDDVNYAKWLRDTKNIDVLNYLENKKELKEEYEFLRLLEREFEKEEIKREILKKIDEIEMSKNTLDSIVAYNFQEWNIKYFDAFVSQENKNYAIFVNQGFLHTIWLIEYTWKLEMEIVLKRRFPNENMLSMSGYKTFEEALKHAIDIKKKVENKDFGFGDNDYLTNINVNDKNQSVERKFISPLRELLENIEFNNYRESSEIISKTEITDYTDIPQLLGILSKALNDSDFNKRYNKLSEEEKQIIEGWREALQKSFKLAFNSLPLLQKIQDEEKTSTSEEDLKKLIKKKVKGSIEEEIEIFKECWWNPNCSIVISNKKKGKYVVWVIIYEAEYKKTKEIFKSIKVSKHKSLEEAKSKFKGIKEKLNSDNPILGVVGEDYFLINEAIEKNTLILENNNINPDEYLKPLDIVWRKNSNNPILPTYHAAIYLGNNQVAHISVYSFLYNQKKEYENKLAQKIDREQHENDEWLKKRIIELEKELKKKKSQSGTSIGINKIKRNDTKARITSWEKFTKGKEVQLTVHHPIIPFKRPEEIIKHIFYTTICQYGKGEYDLFKNNCQHFATLCVCGVPFSEQVKKKVNLVEEIKKSNESFNGNLPELESEVNANYLSKAIEFSKKILVNKKKTVNEKKLQEDLNNCIEKVVDIVIYDFLINRVLDSDQEKEKLISEIQIPPK